MLNTIYALICKTNGKIYIGQTWQTLERRWGNGGGYWSCTYLHNAITKYGKENFYYETLTFCGTQETADHLEEYFMQKYNSRNPNIGYNIRFGGSRGKLSEESKRKIGIASAKKIVSEETRMKISEAGKGRKHTEETKQKMSETSRERKVNVGKKHTEETKAILSEARMGNKSNTGRKLTEEHKAKIAKGGNKGRTWIVIDGKRIWVDK
jgi:group I intron endonuclease